jgi:spermidine/putrescine transport system ATP-binding protein
VTATVPAVELAGLHRRFDEVVAVRDLDLTIGDGEFFSLIGPSGCGKTTTLRMIAGLDHPTSGTVRVSGEDVTGRPAYRRPVNTVFQNYALFPHLNVFENVAFGLRERRMSRREIEPKVREMLALVHLTGREHNRPSQLSGGQQQRVALARALVLEPKMLLLDEPLGALDLKLRKQMQRLLREVQREVGITFLYVTHDQEEAFSMSGRVGVMNAGVLEQVGPPKEVYRRPVTHFVADFVGAVNMFDVVVRESMAGGDYKVGLAGSSREFVAKGPHGLEQGSAAHVVVRPEGVRLNASEEGAPVHRGRIVDTSYSGPHTELTVDADGLGQIMVARRGHEEDDLMIGDGVTVSWPKWACWLVPKHPTAGSTILSNTVAGSKAGSLRPDGAAQASAR